MDGVRSVGSIGWRRERRIDGCHRPSDQWMVANVGSMDVVARLRGPFARPAEMPSTRRLPSTDVEAKALSVAFDMTRGRRREVRADHEDRLAGDALHDRTAHLRAGDRIAVEAR